MSDPNLPTRSSHNEPMLFLLLLVVMVFVAWAIKYQLELIDGICAMWAHRRPVHIRDDVELEEIEGVIAQEERLDELAEAKRRVYAFVSESVSQHRDHERRTVSS